MKPRTVKSNFWIRSPQSDILRLIVKLDANINKDDSLGYVSDPYGENQTRIIAFKT